MATSYTCNTPSVSVRNFHWKVIRTEENEVRILGIQVGQQFFDANNPQLRKL
jgi:hypothetical protein